jgi:YVTN family beta-propeller protein
VSGSNPDIPVLLGAELDPLWLNRVSNLSANGWKNFVARDVAVKPDGSKVYVANQGNGTVSVIDATNTVVATIKVGLAPFGVAVTPDGSTVYVTNLNNAVSVIATATNAVSATISVGNGPVGVAVKSDGSKVYVAN